MKNQKGNTEVIVSFIIVAGLIGLIIYSIMNKSTRVDPLEGVNKVGNIEGDLSNNQTAQNTNMEQISKNGDILVMNYTGRLADGTVFDSNVDPKFGHVTPFEFTLGAGQVIAGWDEGLLGVKIGDKKTLTIAPDKGYGARATGSIPANSTLIFEVELLGIK